MQDYEDVLARISVHSTQQGLDLEHIFGIFAKKSGFINYSEFRKILELIAFVITEKDFSLITMYADENQQGTIFVHDLVQ
jgi:Ca2+-binding EF-hand superfamily protein